MLKPEGRVIWRGPGEIEVEHSDPRTKALLLEYFTKPQEREEPTRAVNDDGDPILDGYAPVEIVPADSETWMRLCAMNLFLYFDFKIQVADVREYR